MKKKLLLLGESLFQKPVVERAKFIGLYVGVADIRPDAPAAALADEFFRGFDPRLRCDARDRQSVRA